MIWLDYLLVLILFQNVRQFNAIITDGNILMPSGEDPNSNVREQRQVIRKMMEHSWNSYHKYAWGQNTLSPMSKKVDKENQMGTTIVNSLSTLLIMNMSDEFRSARDWIETNLNICSLNTNISVSKTVNRIVGSLLSAFAFTNDTMFLNKAKSVSDCLLPAFNTKSGIPNDLIIPKSGKSFGNNDKRIQNLVVLNKFGSLHLEFAYLSAATGASIYAEKVYKIRHLMNNITKPYNGLYYALLNPETGDWAQPLVDIGLYSSGFFKYLLRSWIQSNFTDTEAHDMYYNAIDAIDKQLVLRPHSGLTHLTILSQNEIYPEMRQFTCYAGGMFAHGSLFELNERKKSYFLELGINLTYTCQETFRITATGLGLPYFYFNKEGHILSHKNQMRYVLGAETIESYFYLWRITHDQRYRDYAWSVTQAINKYCRLENGFVGIVDTNDTESLNKIDYQYSYFMAETLKYLYLIFSSDDLIPLTDWIITNGGHPLPILLSDSFRHRVEESTEAMDSTTEVYTKPTQRETKKVTITQSSTQSSTQAHDKPIKKENKQLPQNGIKQAGHTSHLISN